MAVDRNTAILIVDDHKTMLRIVRGLLKQIGFDNVDEATDGASALEKLRNNPFSMVLSDWTMEPMSGLDLLRQIRSDEKLKDTPFIMVTAENKTENVVVAGRAGINGYILKPFNATTLKAKLASVLGQF